MHCQSGPFSPLAEIEDGNYHRSKLFSGRICIIQARVYSTSASSTEITRLLRAWRSGDQTAFDRLATLIYAELRRIARGYMVHERSDHTLQATALVHEAYLQLIDVQNVEWQDRAHFLAVSAQIMRRILIDRARAAAAGKRGGPQARIHVEDIPEPGAWPAAELIAVDEALSTMEQMDARKAKIIELRFFGGLSVEETADVLKISPQTVMRHWKLARIWLERELGKSH